MTPTIPELQAAGDQLADELNQQMAEVLATAGEIQAILDNPFA